MPTITTTNKLGPGKFTVGNTETQIEASCLLNSLTIATSKDQDDPETKLCGSQKPGKVTYTYTVGGNIDLDSDDPQGFWALCQQGRGQQFPFTFQPHDGGTEADGVIVVDPLDFGGEDIGADMKSDFEFAGVGEQPDYTFPTSAPTDPDGTAWWQKLVFTDSDTGSSTATSPGSSTSSSDSASTSDSASDSTSESVSDSTSESAADSETVS